MGESITTTTDLLHATRTEAQEEGLISSYVFAPLDAKKPQTRLLILEKGERDDPLIGTLKCCSVGPWMPSSFTAISYCWGEVSHAEFSILLDSKVLKITKNAHRALVDCRSSKRRQRFWLDQICINQLDVHERSQHIRHMSFIYGHARKVVGYLGPSSPLLDGFFDVMSVLGDDPWQYKSWLRRQLRKPIPETSPMGSLFAPGFVTSPRIIHKLKVSERQVDDLREARENVLSAPWFRRTWVVQEAGLPRRLFLRCGSRVASFDALNCLAGGLATQPLDSPLSWICATGLKSALAISMLRRRIAERSSLMAVVRDFWRKYKSLEAGSSLSEAFRLFLKGWKTLRRREYPPILALLREFRHQLAGDPRDKVFALLGLADQKEVDGLIGSDEQQADYRSSITYVCFHFAVWHILTTQTLDVLSAGCYGAKMHDNLAHWVPDWSQEAPFCETMYAFNNYKEPPHRASLNYAARPDFIAAKQAMILRGFFFDEVDSVVEDLITIENFNRPTDAAWSNWEAFATAEHSPDPYGSHEARYDAYWRTLVYNMNSACQPISSDFGGDFTSWSRGNATPHNIDITGRLVFRGRKLFRTKKGYLGNACGAIKAGDKVCILLGGRFIYVLREHQEVQGLTSGLHTDDVRVERTLRGYFLVGGDSYVHGLMYGEGIESAEKEGLEIEDICLI